MNYYVGTMTYGLAARADRIGPFRDKETAVRFVSAVDEDLENRLGRPRRDNFWCSWVEGPDATWSPEEWLNRDTVPA